MRQASFMFCVHTRATPRRTCTCTNEVLACIRLMHACMHVEERPTRRVQAHVQACTHCCTYTERPIEHVCCVRAHPPMGVHACTHVRGVHVHADLTSTIGCVKDKYHVLLLTMDVGDWLDGAKIKKVASFTIEGRPVGYCTNNGRRYNTKRKRAYLEYKKHIQDNSPIDLPLTASKEQPLVVRTTCYFQNGIHPDPENVHKGVKDALFYGSGGTGDKYTGGSYSPPLYDKENPRVEITLIQEIE